MGLGRLNALVLLRFQPGRKGCSGGRGFPGKRDGPWTVATRSVVTYSLPGPWHYHVSEARRRQRVPGTLADVSALVRPIETPPIPGKRGKGVLPQTQVVIGSVLAHDHTFATRPASRGKGGGSWQRWFTEFLTTLPLVNIAETSCFEHTRCLSRVGAVVKGADRTARRNSAPGIVP